MPIKVISEMLGHSTTKMTLEVYGHVMDSMRQEAANQMDTLMSG